MKKIVSTPENPNGIEVEMTAEEVAQFETDVEKGTAEKIAEDNAKAEKENLKTSAKAKLVAGEPLTEAEADTLIL